LTGDNLGDADAGVDRMEKAAARENLSPEKIADKYIAIFEHDLKELNILTPTDTPRATEYISEIIAMVQILLDKDFAYQTDLAVYFDVSKAKDYTKLSGQNLKENISGAGAGDVEDPQKKNPADFSLWFFRTGKHAQALQYWKSPFHSKLVSDGIGFPGWHIECSAMIKKLLGDTIDIHMGGVEHISIHHTNEIAQSEAANGAPLAHYWLHNEWLIANGGKMSKSEGTAFSLAEVESKGYSPLALRFFFLQAQYRSRQNFTWEALDAAAAGYKNLLHQVAQLGNKNGTVNQVFKDEFIKKITDDFNISAGLAFVFEILKSEISNADKRATILDFDRVLGLNIKIASSQKSETEKIPDEVQKLIDERKIAREQKDWKKSDELRDEIKELGYEVKDTTEGQEIRKI
jgi:cysteinyl-tRNA synthetase